MVAAVASYLGQLGIEREQRVLMVLDDSPAFHACFLGAMRIGAVPVPVNPMDRVDNHVYYLEDSYAKVVVIEDALIESREAMLAARPDVHVPCCSPRSRGSEPPISRRRSTPTTSTTWPSGSTAPAQPAVPRASSTPTGTSA